MLRSIWIWQGRTVFEPSFTSFSKVIGLLHEIVIDVKVLAVSKITRTHRVGDVCELSAVIE